MTFCMMQNIPVVSRQHDRILRIIGTFLPSFVMRFLTKVGIVRESAKPLRLLESIIPRGLGAQTLAIITTSVVEINTKREMKKRTFI